MSTSRTSPGAPRCSASAAMRTSEGAAMRMTFGCKGDTTMKMMRDFLLRRATKVLGAVAALAALLFLLPTFAQAIDLLHNSRDTGSTKWQAQGGWGVAGGKYGEFICATCHEPDADGIKNIRNLISTMNGENWPNGQPDVTVVFQNQSGMGNDSVARSTSARICEVC